MVSPPEEGGLKEARDEDNNIIIVDSILRNILPYKIKICHLDKHLCVGVSVAYLPTLCILTW